jgi:phosphopantothenoylcysteine decarboxylase
MGNILLAVTGSVAAVRTPELLEALRGHGHDVRIIATEPSLYFFDGEDPRFRGILSRDRDEWPRPGFGRGDPVLHIELRKWADLLLVAPLDANTLGKFALGLSDNLVTSVLRAWDFARPVVLAPAMNTMMWDSPVTRRHFRLLLEDRGDGGPAGGVSLDELAGIFERHAPGLVVVAPQSKRLACGDLGLGAMAEVDELADAVDRALGKERLRPPDPPPPRPSA